MKKVKIVKPTIECSCGNNNFKIMPISDDEIVLQCTNPDCKKEMEIIATTDREDYDMYIGTFDIYPDRQKFACPECGRIEEGNLERLGVKKLDNKQICSSCYFDKIYRKKQC